MRTIEPEELMILFKRVYEKILTSTPDAIEFVEDYYRIIPTESWNDFDEPNIHNCSLFDDVEALKKLAADPSRPCTFVDLDRLSAVLRAISHLYNP